MQRSAIEKHGVFQEWRSVQWDWDREGRSGAVGGLGAGEVGRDQSPQGWLCQSRVWVLFWGSREPWKVLGRGMI